MEKALDRVVDAVAVTTEDPLDDIIRANGSAAWRFDEKKWDKRLSYLVCLAKKGSQRQAFMVGCLSGITLRNDESDTHKRYVFHIDSYALLGEDAKIIDGSQFPVRYGSVRELTGLDPNDLDFERMPPKTLPYSYSNRAPAAPRPKGISIAEAKRRLSVELGVREEQIDIIVRA